MNNIVNNLKNFFNTSTKEQEVNVGLPNITMFRPSTFNEYIGQQKAKKILDKHIKGIKKRELIFPHLLIHSSPGMGKTTLARILANILEVPIVEGIASEIKDTETLIKKIYQAQNGILFLDEIHSMPRDIAEKLYPMMEDFTFEGKNLPFFTLVGATTELGEIIKTRKPFLQRFKLKIELENYQLEDLQIIVSQYKNNMFPNDTLKQEVYEILSRNCRGTPRTLLSLLESTVYFDGDVGDVLDTFGILHNGITIKDIKLLRYIASNPNGVGLSGIVSYLDTSTQNYLYEIEPFLLQNNYLIRTPRGRKITKQGIDLIASVEVGNEQG